VFTNTVGKQELPKLNYFQGGAQFRIPTVGAKVENGMVTANIQFPGLDIRYTTDGTEPTISSPLYTAPMAIKDVVRFRAFDSKGRGGRSIKISK
jgi:hexosaminidase